MAENPVEEKVFTISITEEDLRSAIISANAPMVAAIVSAIQRLEQTLREKETTIELDGKEIGSSTVEYIQDFRRRTGVNPVG